MDSFNGLVGVASSLNRPPLSLRMCIAPLITPTARVPTRKLNFENRPIRLPRRQKGRHTMTLRMCHFPVFFEQVLDKTGLTDG